LNSTVRNFLKYQSSLVFFFSTCRVCNNTRESQVKKAASATLDA
jgi:hypothetical protein